MRPATSNDTRFEFECYDIAHLYNLAHFADRKLVKPPFFVQSVFGLLGGIGTHPEDVAHMKRTADRLFGDSYRWSVLGAGASQLRIAAQAAAMGSNIRVGLEDSLWAGRGKLAKSNAEQVDARPQDHRRARQGGRDARRGARNPHPQGRRQGRLLGRAAMLRIEVACADRDQLGEGPLWDVDEQRLYWIDSYGPAIHRMEPNGAKKTWTLARADRLDGAAPKRRRDPVAAQRLLYVRFHHRRGQAHLRDPTGRIAAAPQRRQGRSAGPFRRRLDGFRRARRGRQTVSPRSRSLSSYSSIEGIICSNGPCWSPDGRTLYFADTGRRAIYAYDYDTSTGEVRSRRLFASFDKLRGFPDGATVDEEGYVWSVEVYSGRLIRFDPLGVIDRIVGLPVQSTTSLTFGGANLDIAYVTSMARPMGGQYHREREAGCLFAIHGLGVRGLPEPRFAG